VFGFLWVAFWIGGIIYTHGAILRLTPTYFFAPFIPILCLFIFIRARRLEREHKALVWLKVNGESLSFHDEFGKSETRAISDIVHWELGKTKAALAFSDGAKLNDLEKLRYWPLLREYLLSKLEPKERT